MLSSSPPRIFLQNSNRSRICLTSLLKITWHAINNYLDSVVKPDGTFRYSQDNLRPSVIVAFSVSVLISNKRRMQMFVPTLSKSTKVALKNTEFLTQNYIIPYYLKLHFRFLTETCLELSSNGPVFIKCTWFPGISKGAGTECWVFLVGFIWVVGLRAVRFNLFRWSVCDAESIQIKWFR